MNRLLLDTHTFLWWDSTPQRLSDAMLALCRDPTVVLYLSLVSLWEIAIKSSLIRPNAPEGVSRLPLRLPPHHRDPLDRLLIAQALPEGLPLASVDSQSSPYPISVIW